MYTSSDTKAPTQSDASEHPKHSSNPPEIGLSESAPTAPGQSYETLLPQHLGHLGWAASGNLPYHSILSVSAV